MKQHFDMEIKLCNNECPMFYLVLYRTNSGMLRYTIVQ